MALPVKATVEDVAMVCKYLASKPTGATIKEAGAIIDAKHLDQRKIAAINRWGFIEEAGNRWKVSATGRAFARGTDEERGKLLRSVIAGCSPYKAIVERASHHLQENSVSAADVAAHWHSHFKEDAADSDRQLNLQAVCFFNVAEGAGLGALVMGRKGSPTRFEWDRAALVAGVEETAADPEEAVARETDCPDESGESGDTGITPMQRAVNGAATPLGQAIFLAHGKNKVPVEQLKKILGGFNIPFKVAVDEPNLGRPISSKVRETMQLCNCAILIFTADEQFRNKNDEEIWRPSENVVYELGACSYLYGDRVVIIKEDKVVFPSNFRDIGYISFTDGGLDAKAMEIIRELIGFKIVKVST